MKLPLIVMAKGGRLAHATYHAELPMRTTCGQWIYAMRVRWPDHPRMCPACFPKYATSNKKGTDP